MHVLGVIDGFLHPFFSNHYSQHVFPECSCAAPPAGKEWEEYIQIRDLVEKIRKKQKGEFTAVFVLKIIIIS